jgi:hypothetical protein
MQGRDEFDDLAAAATRRAKRAQAGNSHAEPNGGVHEAPTSWPDPAPLPEGLPSVQAFDPALLPDGLRPWVEDIAERMQAPMDYPAVGAVIAVGAVTGRQVGIRPKRHDDWTVVPNLWGGIVGRPGLLKTPALQEACRPLVWLEMQAKNAFERAETEHGGRREIARQQKKLREGKIAKDLRPSATRRASCTTCSRTARTTSRPPGAATSSTTARSRSWARSSTRTRAAC